MSKQAFRVEGEFQMGRQRQHFSIEVLGEDEDGARSAAFAEMGSRHGVKRRDVAIESVAALGADASPITKKRLG